MSTTSAGLQIGSTAASLSTTGSTSSSDARMVHSAHDFEAMMMKELLKPMTEQFMGGDGEETGALAGGSALGEFASEALGRALSQQGGFGIANKIIGSFSHSGTQQVTGTVTKLGTSNTVIGADK